MNDILEAVRERACLVRLCTHLTGDPDAAEDLAQETLLEAYRHAHKLYDASGRNRRLAAIARNICFRWMRRQGRVMTHFVQFDANDEPTDMLDLENEWERRELIAVLDRALSLVPSTTRQILVARYIHELPYTTIAEQFGLSEDVIAMRLHRGRLLLRRILTTELQEAAMSFNFNLITGDEWQTTRIWCLICGKQRLLARLPPTSETVAFRCPECSPDPHVPEFEYLLSNASFAQLIGGLVRPKVILSRTASWAHMYFRHALAERAARCTNCNQAVDVQVTLSDDLQTLQHHPHVLLITCESCSTAVSTSFRGLIINIPEVQTFWRHQARIRMLPEYEVEVAGEPVIVTPAQQASPVSFTLHHLRRTALDSIAHNTYKFCFSDKQSLCSPFTSTCGA